MVRRLASLTTLFTLPGCYLGQAALGQLELIQRARPIDRAMADLGQPEHVRRLLREVPRIKAFAIARGLTPTASYERYVPLDREAVVWVVTACAPLAFEPKVWSFPIAGSFTYLGWFDRAAAEAHAATLAAEGLDTYVRGAGAYSTLGWFADPILSTMLPDSVEDLGDLVDVVLHESVHATVYVNGQSTFNEGLASFVAEALTHEYLEAESAPALARYAEGQARARARSERLHAAYLALEALYAADRSEADKRAEKARILSALAAELRFARPPNNATLVQFRTYRAASPAFARAFEACGRDWRRFLERMGRLRPADFGEEQTEALDFIVERCAR